MTNILEQETASEIFFPYFGMVFNPLGGFKLLAK
jgi:hypothetical protein